MALEGLSACGGFGTPPSFYQAIDVPVQLRRPLSPPLEDAEEEESTAAPAPALSLQGSDGPSVTGVPRGTVTACDGLPVAGSDGVPRGMVTACDGLPVAGSDGVPRGMGTASDGLPVVSPLLDDEEELLLPREPALQESKKVQANDCGCFAALRVFTDRRHARGIFIER
ncbi:unnamed protein product [Symbiodinium natans]|uniref:Uncharacterized protein n=1 Tax=Symbiodinium natans TaxID=878477 RepID=A0A812Q287_9DINO|nr:unnamed protein product [Symbiodinium natans]